MGDRLRVEGLGGSKKTESGKWKAEKSRSEAAISPFYSQLLSAKGCGLSDV
jgi:hypothetical protein